MDKTPSKMQLTTTLAYIMWLPTTVDLYKTTVNWQKLTSPHVIVTILDLNSRCVTIIKPHTETIPLRQ